MFFTFQHNFTLSQYTYFVAKHQYLVRIFTSVYNLQGQNLLLSLVKPETFDISLH